MDTSFIQDDDKYEEMTLDSEPSAIDPFNTSQVIDIDVEMEAIKKLIEDCYDTKINHNYPNFPIIRKKLKNNVELYVLASI